MDDVFEAMECRRRRFLRLRGAKAKKARHIDYADLLKPSVVPEDRCPHTLQPITKDQCSQCSGIKVKRVQPKVAVPLPDEE